MGILFHSFSVHLETLSEQSNEPLAEQSNEPLAVDDNMSPEGEPSASNNVSAKLCRLRQSDGNLNNCACSRK